MIGVDIVQNNRFENIDDKLLNKIFSESEIIEANKRVNKAEYYASRFAAKEAFVKAIGTGFRRINAKDIVISNDKNGKPFFKINNTLFDNIKAHLSISHEKDYSVAMVVLDGKK